MQDIRKPYNRSRSSNQGLNHRVEAFESNSYAESSNEDVPVHIPIERRRHVRRNLDKMEMYPRRASEETYESEETSVEEVVNAEVNYRDPRTRYKNKRTSLGTWIFILTIMVLVIGAGLLTYVFNTAKVTIVPKHADLFDFHKPITFGQAMSDTSNVPFIVATSSITKTKTLTLAESHKVETKASGKIIVYNNFDNTAQKLIKGTRFESAAGKMYRINQSIVVPGKSGDKPGSIEVTVYADSYGEDYNGDKLDFTIPGFKDSPRYKGFFARSSGPMTGGMSGDVSSASLSDINAAKDELALELAQEVKAELAKVEKEGYINMSTAAEITYEDNQDELLKGTTSTYQVTATGHLMLADAGLFAMAIAKNVRDYENEPVRLGYLDTLTYTRKDTDHIDASTTLDILVEGNPSVIWLSDIDAIKKAVAGKGRSEFKPIMKMINSIEGAEISFSPLWLSSFPTDINKITVVESLPKR